MGFGESPFPVHERLKKALANAAHRKEYAKADGLDELAETAREYYRPIYGDEYINAINIVIAPGSKLNIYALQMAIEGDLLIPVPSWVSYEPQTRMLHRDVIKIPTHLDNAGYHIAPEALKQTIHQARKDGKNPKKIILNAPNNPTGLTIPQAELAAIADICRQEDIFIISDEIYGLINFDNTYRSIAPYAPERTAVTTGLSKHLSLGGWRIGVCFVPKAIEGLHNAMRCIASETWSCVPSPIQAACIEAYKRHPDIEEYRQNCTNIHALMNTAISKGLQNHGIIAPTAQGAFYNYPDFEPFRGAFAQNGITTSQKMHEILLNDYNLATLPGRVFGAEEKVLTLRLSGSDYDGAAAIVACQQGETLDNTFIEKYAPRIVKAIDLFGEFITRYGAEK